jgi:hypothetical protein
VFIRPASTASIRAETDIRATRRSLLASPAEQHTPRVLQALPAGGARNVGISPIQAVASARALAKPGKGLAGEGILLMLATDELELAYPGTGAPAFGGGPPLRRILVAVRARRSSRSAGGRGALRPHDWRRAAPGTRAHVRPARAPRGPVLHGDGRHSGRARQGTAGRLGLRRPAVHSRVQHPD